MTREQQEKMIREEWFKDHIAKFSDEGRFKSLEWRHPNGGSNYWCRFIISGSFLIVFGDVGDAVFCWGQNLTWEWLATMDVGYFEGKCQASEDGRRYRSWDSDKAKKALEEMFAEEGMDSAKEKFEGLWGWNYITSQHEWWSFLGADGHSVFCGNTDGLGSIGEVISIRCQGHLIAIKMAVAQEAERQKQISQPQ